MEQLKIIIGKGKVRVDAGGFQGKTCLAQLKRYEEFMRKHGVKVHMDHQVLKPEAEEEADVIVRSEAKDLTT
jgi:N-dimethylarginine dimethylaminohydrolase